MFHSASSFGDEESIDKNSANTIKIAAMAPANIERPTFWCFLLQLQGQAAGTGVSGFPV
jgi:mannose/fructose/N-acetylgalactosamine-specific phosphotransferase system component IID